ncbi:MAG: hypothetical protein HDS65_04165 [Bacteroidales bacterium]|nr:hypothetical protein [Bacteroidales bacterium]
MIKRIFRYLQLQKVGAFELFAALYPILSGYSYGPLHGNIIFILILAVWALFKKRKHFKTLWLNVLIAFVLVHEFFLMLLIPVPGYFLNNTISIALISISILPICRAINFEKFAGSLNWVAIMTIGGLVYQAMIVFAGGIVTPLKLPFMPAMDATTRLYEEVVRPTSFFWEPASFVTFLMVPLFISLLRKTYVWSGIIILSMFLSTSSTGILMSFIILALYLMSQKVKMRTRIMVVVLGIGLAFALVKSSYFEAGINKIENTDIESNIRLMNGIYLFESMDAGELILGFKAPNVEDFAYMRHVPLLGRGAFVPTFWLTWAKYGIFGLAILLTMYLSFIRADRTTLPYVVVLIIAMSFQSISFGSSTFAYQLIFLYSYINRNYITQRLTRWQKVIR